jgi:hypothetical protein
MTKLTILTAGLLAAMLATPAMAQEAIQEPGPMAQNYPDVDYLTGGYGVRATPPPRYYYRHRYYGPAPGPAGLAAGVVGGAVGTAAAIAAAPFQGGYSSYGYYEGPDY